MQARTSRAVLLPILLALAGCEDRDGDFWADEADNCPDAANATQVDRDEDGLGDACDDDGIVRLLVVRVETPDGGVPASDASILATLDDVARYYLEVSDGSLRIAGLDHPAQAADLAGPVPVGIAYDGFNDLQIVQAADQALVAAGVDRSRYGQTIFVVPDTFGNRTPRGFTSGWASGSDLIWMRAVAIGRPGAIGHEIGHNLPPGLGHANLLQCSGPAPYDLAYSGCVPLEYLDPFDAMGWSEQRGHMSGASREQVGFFAARNVLEVTQSGAYWLPPIETPWPGVRTLKIRRSPQELIYLEYRQPIGYDAGSVGGLAGSSQGVQIRTTYFGGYSTALILPEGAFSLAPGRTYDATAFTVTTLESFPDATLIQIEFR